MRTSRPWIHARRMNRRELLAVLGRCAGGVCLGGALAPLAWGKPPAEPRWQREIDFYTRLPESRIQCLVCPRQCVLEDGETRFCRTRTNVAGQFFTRAYSNPCILRIDPIEKMPLNHFRPGTQTLTIAVGGCNLRCTYCQNWQQSQKSPDELKTFPLTPEEAVKYARKKRVDTIAFNYTEPVAFLEYARDIAALARRARLKVVAATAAFVQPDPLIDFAKYVDAFVISLKGFDEEFYHTVTGVRLAPVLRAIETVRSKTRSWLEIVNLIVPTYNDDPEQIRAMVAWLHEHVGDDVPLHLARFEPMYRLTHLPRTPVPTLEAACRIAREAGLRYVYTSNVAPHEGTNTFCAACRTPVIQRLGFRVLENRLQGGSCPSCRARLPGVWS